MKKTVKTLVMITLVIAIIFPLAIPVQAAGSFKNSWKFSVGSDQILYVGQAGTYAGNPSGGIDGIYGTMLQFKSSNSKVATVDENEKLVAKKVGTAKITATDGVYKDSYKVTVKDPKKTKKVVLNYAESTEFEYGKTYTLKSLNGSSVKKIECESNYVTVKGNKITARPVSDRSAWLTVTLKDGKSTEVRFWFEGREYTEAVSIIEKAAAEAGISKSSTDLEKAMFAYNWLGEHCSYSRKYTRSGHYYAIREGKGACGVYAEGVELIGEVIGLTVIRIGNRDYSHAFNGVRVDGEWYVMDTTSVKAWDFANGGGCFLLSYEEAAKNGLAFNVSAKSEIKPEFTSTKYDDPKVFSQYKDNYKDALTDDDFNLGY